MSPSSAGSHSRCPQRPPAPPGGRHHGPDRGRGPIGGADGEDGPVTTGPAQLRCTATSIVDDSGCPSVLRVRVVDAAGRTWYLVDKEPVFRSGGAPLRERDLPAAVAVRCEVVETGPT